jgi:LacI family transcriptional regulator
LIDNHSAIVELVDHMIDKHQARKFAFVGGPIDTTDASERASAVVEHTRQRGVALEPLEPWRGDYTPGMAYDIVMSLCADKSNLPDVIMGVNDGSAMGVIAALTKLGVRVPADVAVTGFDDVELARLTPPLTTVRQPIGEMARLAVEAVSTSITRATSTSRKVSAELAIRRSCGCSPRQQPRAATRARD